MCVHALPALWQAESVCAHNEQGVSGELCGIIPRFATPNGQKAKLKQAGFSLRHSCVLVGQICGFISSASLSENQLWGILIFYF